MCTEAKHREVVEYGERWPSLSSVVAMGGCDGKKGVNQTCNQRGYVANVWKQIQYRCTSINDHLNHLHCKDESNTPYSYFQGNMF